MDIGYNIEEASKLVEEIVSKYKMLGDTISEEWDVVKATLRSQWIGMDEASYEKHLVSVICNAYIKSYDVVVGVCRVIENLVNEWIRFQRENVIDGTVLNELREVSFSTLPIRNEMLIQYSEQTFSNSQDMGLVSENSANQIKNSLDGYVSVIRSKVDELFMEIDGSTKKAFFGEQQRNEIYNYIEKSSDIMGEILVAIKDIYEKIDTLITRNYTNMGASIGDTVSQSRFDV